MYHMSYTYYYIRQPSLWIGKTHVHTDYILLHTDYIWIMYHDTWTRLYTTRYNLHTRDIQVNIHYMCDIALTVGTPEFEGLRMSCSVLVLNGRGGVAIKEAIKEWRPPKEVLHCQHTE